MTWSNDRRPPAGLLIILLAALLFLLCLYACKCPPQIASSDTVRNSNIQIIPHDTTVYLNDSARLRALLYCDSIGQVKIRQIQDYYAGQWIKPKVVIRDNYLNVDCKIDSAAIVVRWNERHETTSNIIHTVTVPPAVNYVTGFQWFQIWLARILLAAGAIVGIYYILKSTTWWTALILWLGKLIANLFKKKV